MTDASVRGEAPRRRAAPILWALLAAAFVIFVLWKVGELVFIAFIAALVAVYLGGLTDFLVRKFHPPRWFALIAALLLTFIAIGLVGALLVPPVVQQTQDLVTNFPHYLANLDKTIHDLAMRYPLVRRSGFADSENDIVSRGLTEVAGFVQHSLLGYAAGAGQFLIEGVAVLVMALYMAAHPRVYADGVVSLVPPRHRDTARLILADVARSLHSWVKAQLLDMVVLAVLSGIGLWILGVPYFLAFAIFTGLVALIPFFGTIFSTVLPALLVLGDRGLLPFFGVASVGVIVHILEANVVNPIIMQHRVSLPPVLTIFAVLVMAKLGGLLGLVVAVPMLAVAMVIVRHVLLQKTYGDEPPKPEPVTK